MFQICISSNCNRDTGDYDVIKPENSTFMCCSPLKETRERRLCLLKKELDYSTLLFIGPPGKLDTCIWNITSGSKPVPISIDSLIQLGLFPTQLLTGMLFHRKLQTLSTPGSADAVPPTFNVAVDR